MEVNWSKNGGRKWQTKSRNNDGGGRAVEERRKSERENARWKNKEGAQRRFQPLNRHCPPWHRLKRANRRRLKTLIWPHFSPNSPRFCLLQARCQLLGYNRRRETFTQRRLASPNRRCALSATAFFATSVFGLTDVVLTTYKPIFLLV